MNNIAFRLKNIISSKKFVVSVVGLAATAVIIRYVYEKSLSDYQRMVRERIQKFNQESRQDPWTFFNAFLNKPQDYLFSDVLSSKYFLGRDLYECSCPGSRLHDRLDNNRRQSIEKRMIEDAKKFFSQDEPIVYASMGSGGLLQDLINVGKLLRAGYGNVTVYLVDPKLPKNSLKAFRSFLDRAAKAKDFSLTIQAFESVERCPKKFHILSTVDYDPFYDTFGDWLKAQERLENNGRHYFSRGPYDLTFSSSGLVDKKFHKTKDSRLPLHQLQIQSEQEELSYAQLGAHPLFFIGQWAFFIPTLAKHASKLSVTCVAAPENQELNNEKRLRKFLRLCLGREIPLELKLVDSIQEVVQSEKQYNIVSWLGFCIKSSRLESEESFFAGKFQGIQSEGLNELRTIYRQTVERDAQGRQQQPETVEWIKKHASSAYFLRSIEHPDRVVQDVTWKWEKAQGTTMLSDEQDKALIQDLI